MTRRSQACSADHSLRVQGKSHPCAPCSNVACKVVTDTPLLGLAAGSEVCLGDASGSSCDSDSDAARRSAAGSCRAECTTCRRQQVGAWSPYVSHRDSRQAVTVACLQLDHAANGPACTPRPLGESSHIVQHQQYGLFWCGQSGGHLNDVLDLVLGLAAAASLRDVLLLHLRTRTPRSVTSLRSCICCALPWCTCKRLTHAPAACA